MQTQRRFTREDSKQPPRIGELLVRADLITPGQLQEALEKQRTDGGKLVENLIAMEFLDSKSFVRFLSSQPGIASIDLLNYTIPSDVISLIDREFALKHEIVPIDKMGRDLTVGMACPLDAKTIGFLEEQTGFKIRPLLVSMNDIRVALDNYYRIKNAPMAAYSLDGDLKLPPASRVTTPGSASIALVQSGIKFEKVIHLIREISSLPTLPETVHQVRAAMDDPNTSTQAIADIISFDPLLAAKVVSLANSAAYSFAHNVDTIERATALLGLREVYSVVLASAVVEYFTEGNHFDHKKFWRRSMTGATACKLIAKHNQKSTVSNVFAAGLMHDIGRAVLAEIAPKQYAGVDQSLPESEVIAHEEELFGLAHPEVGYLLADGWGLPDDIKEPIRFHHDFEQAQSHRDIVAITALGAVIADSISRDQNADPKEIAASQAELLQELCLTIEQVADIYTQTLEAINAENTRA